MRVSGSTRTRLVRAAATALALLAIVLCAAAVANEWSRVSESIRSADPAWTAVGLGCALAAMVIIAAAWRASITALGGSAPNLTTTLRWYFAGELGKYLPGGLWAVLGRGELVRRGGVTRSVGYSSVMLSLLALYGSAVFPLGVLALHPSVVRWWRSKAQRLLRREIVLDIPDLSTVLRLLAMYLPAWIAIAACTIAIAHAFDAGGSPTRLAIATVAAWVVGFAMVPIPAGAGVREVVFVALAGLPAGVAVAVAVTCRLCFLLVDGVGGAIASASLGINRDDETTL